MCIGRLIDGSQNYLTSAQVLPSGDFSINQPITNESIAEVANQLSMSSPAQFLLINTGEMLKVRHYKFFFKLLVLVC